eukprot:2928857-Pyramimonas_sp.AAC.1
MSAHSGGQPGSWPGTSLEMTTCPPRPSIEDLLFQHKAEESRTLEPPIRAWAVWGSRRTHPYANGSQGRSRDHAQ